jgi:hypothetical protein
VLAKLQILTAVLHALPAVHHALLSPAQFPFAASVMGLADQLSLSLLSTIWDHQKSFSDDGKEDKNARTRMHSKPVK